MKKVLIINTATTSKSNGISNIALMYAKSVSADYYIDLVMAGKIVKEDIVDIKKIFRNIYKAKYSRIKNPLKYSEWLSSIIKIKKYDIIHVHGNSATMFLEINTAKRCGVLVRVCHCHSTSCKFKIVHYLLKTPLNYQLTAAIACSQEAGKWLYNKNFQILNNGINSKEFVFNETDRKKYRNAFGLNDQFIIGHVGYLSDEKNQKFLIEIAELLSKQIDNFKIILIGDGPLKAKLKFEIKKRALDKYIILLGRRNDVSKIYSAMDMFVFPSKFEGFGLALIEAQTNGLRCIASNKVPIITQLSKNTIYFNLDYIDLWVKTIIKIYNLNKKINRVEESKNNQLTLISKGFDIENNRQKLIDIYEENK